MLAPLAFFTASRNILEAYVLPALPAFALLCALLWLRLLGERPAWKHAVWLGLIAPLAMVGWLALSPQAELRSQRALLRHWDKATPLVYLGARPLSANFYSHGQAQWAETVPDMKRWLISPAHSDPAPTLVLQDNRRAELATQVTSDEFATWQAVARHDGFTMLRRLPVPPALLPP
jgi:hypothetical protein